jgi:hypothetical protein
VQFEPCAADLDALAGPEPHGFGAGPAIDEGAMARAEVFDQRVIVIDRELRVARRDAFGLDAEVGVLGPASTSSPGRTV